MSKLDLVNGWSCDERNRSACRNPHGCHCREITALRGRPAESARLIEALNKVNDWLVCHSIASDEDMAQSFPTMCKIVNDALALTRPE